MNLTQILYNLYQDGQITILADGTASYTMHALMAIAKAAEESPAFAIVRHTHEQAQYERLNRERMAQQIDKPDYCGDLKSALSVNYGAH